MKPGAKSPWSPASSEPANSLPVLNAAAPPGIRTPTSGFPTCLVLARHVVRGAAGNARRGKLTTT
jgi:hypothetical protein